MKKLVFLLFGMQLFFSAILFAQNIKVITPTNGNVKIAPEVIKNIVQQNFQLLKLKNNWVKIFYTKDSTNFIIAKLSRFSYSASFLLIKYDGNSVSIQDSNYHPQTVDFGHSTQNNKLQKTATTYDFLFDTPGDTITSVNAVNNVSTYATNQNYKVHTLLYSSDNINNVENAITNENIIGMGHVGHGTTEGIYLPDGLLTYTWFSSQNLNNKIFFFNSCLTFYPPYHPLENAIMTQGARTFIGGKYYLPFVSSDLVFQDFWYNTITYGYSMYDALTTAMNNHNLSSAYDLAGDHGIMNLTTNGTLRGNEIWSGNITVTGDVTVPAGIYLGIGPGSTINFTNNAKLIVNGSIAALGCSTSPVLFNFISPSSTYNNGIVFNSNSSGTIDYCQIRNADRGIYENGVSINITNSAFSYCNSGIYLYNSSPTFQNCNIHENSYYGIYLTNSSPTLYNDNLIANNPCGICCSTNSNPIFEGGGIVGHNNFTTNTIGVSCANNSLPILGWNSGSNDLTNTSLNLQNLSSGVVYALMNYWGSMNPSLFKIYNPGSVIYYNYQNAITIPAPPLSKSSATSPIASNDIPLIDQLNQIKELITGKNLEQARNVCLNLIANYPDYDVSYNALNLLKDTYANDSSSSVNSYHSIFNSKVKNNINAMAGLILADIDKGNRLSRINDVINNYQGHGIVELALYDKFVYHYFEKQDKQNATTISKQLDQQFPLSWGAIEAHRVLGDTAYFKINSYNDPAMQKTSSQQTPTEFALIGNYPNPFNPTTRISYQLPKNGFVTLKVYDILGREVASLVKENQKAGNYSIPFDASKLSSGIYIYTIRANDFIQSKKMNLVK